MGRIIIGLDKTVTQDTGDEIITYELASFGSRFGARVIDVLIVFIPNSIIPILPAWLYYSLMQSRIYQATVGQKAMGIYVLSLDGKRISFGQATGRFFGSLLSAFLFCLGYAMFFFNDKNQCLHDYMSGCIVVREIGREEKQKEE